MWFIVAVVAVVLLVVLLSFNSLRKLEQGVRKDWNNITTELERRTALIPNLVETVEQYASHERSLLEEVTRARADATKVAATPAHAGEVAETQGMLDKALMKLVATAEDYPDLKASENYRQLQADLTDTEDRIAASRKLYNSAVETLNQRARTFPANLVKPLAGVGMAEYYTVSEDRMAQIEPDIDVSSMFGEA